MGNPVKARKKGKRRQEKKRSKGGLMVLLLIVLLLILSVQLYHLFQDLHDASEEEAAYAVRLAELQETNKRLADDIANRDNLDLIEDIARNELGMAEAGEKIFRFSSK